MSVRDFRRYACDSCTQHTDVRLASNAAKPPPGWVQASLSNASRANFVRWWCPACVDAISRRLPNALGELDPVWPQTQTAAAYYCDKGPCCLEGGHEGGCKQ